MNYCILVGRIVADPQLGRSKNGKDYCRFTLAVDKLGKDSGASFFNCVAWEKRGETIARYVKKGNKFLVSGRLDQSLYEKGGVKQSFVSLIVDNFEFFENKKSDGGSQSGGGAVSDEADNMKNEQLDLSSIPF